VLVRIWLLRLAWVTLPLSAGAAAGDAIAGFDDAPRVVAAVLLWLSWGAGAVALLAPRPAGLTLLRAVAPAYAVLAIAAAVAGTTHGLAGWGAVAGAGITAVLTSMPDIARAAANGIAYGDEERFPLRVPPALFLGPLPLARALVVGAVAAGPLLIADGSVVIGLIALAVGGGVVAIGARALHGLSRRWLVLVPAGVVVVDPMTLAEPVLFVRRHVRALRPSEPSAAIADDALDLRLGSTLGNVLIDLDESAEMVRTNRGGRGGVTVQAARLLVAVTQRSEFLAIASSRRVRVEVRSPTGYAAIPPPTSTSSS
jgi:hypothetical protein